MRRSDYRLALFVSEFLQRLLVDHDDELGRSDVDQVDRIHDYPQLARLDDVERSHAQIS